VPSSHSFNVAGEQDLDFCAGILAKISLEESVPAIEPARAWAFPPMISTAAVALGLLLVALFAVVHFKKPTGVAMAPVEELVELRIPAPNPPREMTLAYAMQQQELLQRDALKLGAHLRENLILFRTVEK